jgi:endonuclease YncB( thermonuclease family)
MNQFKHLAQMALGLALALLGPHTTLAATNPGPTLQGQVVRVSDGDTVTLQTQDSTIKIRLAGIDAPETKMPHGPQAKAHLAALVLGKQVQAIVQKKDRYGRTIATLMLNTKDVNLAMVQAGMAWHYKQYEREQTASAAAAYAQSETQARTQGVGLWQFEMPIPPWEWRQIRANATKNVQSKS